MSKYSSDKAKAEDYFAQTCLSIYNGVINVALCLYMLLFPLILHDYYFDILETKYHCFLAISLAMAGVLLLLSLAMSFVDLKEYRGEHVKAVFASLSPKNWKSTFRAEDAALLAYGLFAAISTLQSRYTYEAFWGNEGRYSGLFLILIYIMVYFIISRIAKPREWYLQLFLISGMIICIFGMTDYFQMDLLNIRGKMSHEQSIIFTSTLGNINSYTAYVGLIAGIAAGMFCMEKNALKCCWYYACTFISLVAIIMGCSDNTYLSIFAILVFLPFFLFRNREGILRYLILLATFGSAVQTVLWVDQKYADIVIPQNGLFLFFKKIPHYHFLVLGLWVLSALWAGGIWLARKKQAEAAGKKDGLQKGDEPYKECKILVFAWACFCVLSIAAALALFCDANFLGHADRYGSIGQYLIFDQNWGNSRGYIWGKSWDLFKRFTLRAKLFGYGPDTFGILTHNHIYGDMIEVTGFYYDNAHNEYLQLLITNGLTGFTAYLAFLAALMFRLVKKMAAGAPWRTLKSKNSLPDSGSVMLMGICCAVLAYLFQAVVNLNLPIVAPMAWLLWSIGEALCRKEDTM